MDELIKQLEEVTSRFLDEIDEADYLVTEQFVEQREAIIFSIKESLKTEPLLEKHKLVLNKLLQGNSVITKKLTSLRDEANKNINNFQVASTQRSAYNVNPANGSHFFDSQK